MQKIKVCEKHHFFLDVECPTSRIDSETNFLSILKNFFINRFRIRFDINNVSSGKASSEPLTTFPNRSAKNAIFWQVLTSLRVPLHMITVVIKITYIQVSCQNVSFFFTFFLPRLIFAQSYDLNDFRFTWTSMISRFTST